MLIAGCFFMSGLYFKKCFDTTNPPPHYFFHLPLFLFPTHPPLLFSDLYCVMDSFFLSILAIPSKTVFCKVSTLYDMSNFFKLHPKSFGMDPSAPVMIGSINVSLYHILAISNRSSE